MTVRSDLELFISDPIALSRAHEYLMKRTPLTRKTPMARSSSKLTRSPMKRGRPGKQPPERRDDAYKAWIRAQPCCAPTSEAYPEPCTDWPCDPNHQHGDGKSIKTHDHTCIPLSRICHDGYEAKNGRFKGFTKQQTRDWHAAQAERLRALYTTTETRER